MKKTLFIVLSLIMAIVSVTGYNAETTTEFNESKTIILYINNPIMEVNGVRIEIDDKVEISPIIQNGNTLVPIRAIIEAIGGKVEWNNEIQTILLYKDNNTISMTINSEHVYFNNKEYTISTPPVIINSRTYLPIRFIAEKFGFDVDWNENMQRIIITIENESTINSMLEESSNNSNIFTENEVTNETDENSDMININLKINSSNFNALLYDNKTTRELIKHFPITYSMSELHGNEKYYYMEKSLPTESETPDTINKGDIMLYGSDCIVVFYDTFPNSYRYTRLGYIEDTTNLENAVGNGNIEISFELK